MRDVDSPIPTAMDRDEERSRPRRARLLRRLALSRSRILDLALTPALAPFRSRFAR